MNHPQVNIANLAAGQVIWAAPGPLIVPDVLTSQTLSKQRKDKHPLMVLFVNVLAQEITVTYIASFSKSPDLASVNIPKTAKDLFVPVTPAVQEFVHAPIAWMNHPAAPAPAPCWVSVRNKTVLRGATFPLFDNNKSFSPATAGVLNGMINTTV